MKHVKNACAVCGGNIQYKLSRFSEPMNKEYDIFKCGDCRNWQIYPVPDEKDLQNLYESNYFSKRSDRGYDNYTGEAVKKSVISTLEKNLTDLDFYKWENTLAAKLSLEIGAAAGFFVEYLQNRNWESTGIDISKSMTDAAQKKGLQMIHGDFLKHDFKNRKFDLIALWATLEHLPHPDQYIHKISQLLKPEGRLYLTTTNTGFWAKIYGVKWRYLNVPEHIFYFNRRSLKYLFKQSGLEIAKAFTYGSGFTSKKNAPFYFNLAKKIADRSAKHFLSGDMIVLDVRHDIAGSRISK